MGSGVTAVLLLLLQPVINSNRAVITIINPKETKVETIFLGCRALAKESMEETPQKVMNETYNILR
jgi:hypothetical protein